MRLQAYLSVLMQKKRRAVRRCPTEFADVTAKHPGCNTYSIGACTAGAIYGMCGNADTQLIVSGN